MWIRVREVCSMLHCGSWSGGGLSEGEANEKRERDIWRKKSRFSWIKQVLNKFSKNHDYTHLFSINPVPTIIRVQLVPEHKYIFTVSFSTNHSLLSTCKNLRRSLTEFYWLQSNLKVKSWNKNGYITAILRKGSKMLQLCLWNLSCGCPVIDREYQLWRDFSQDSSQTRSWWMMRWI